jgi:hypothetical protein
LGGHCVERPDSLTRGSIRQGFIVRDHNQQALAYVYFEGSNAHMPDGIHLWGMGPF